MDTGKIRVYLLPIDGALLALLDVKNKTQKDVKYLIDSSTESYSLEEFQNKCNNESMDLDCCYIFIDTYSCSVEHIDN